MRHKKRAKAVKQPAVQILAGPRAQRYLQKVTTLFANGVTREFFVATQTKNASDALLLLETCGQLNAACPSFYRKNVTFIGTTRHTVEIICEIDVLLPEPVRQSVRHLWQKQNN